MSLAPGQPDSASAGLAQFGQAQSTSAPTTQGNVGPPPLSAGLQYHQAVKPDLGGLTNREKQEAYVKKGHTIATGIVASYYGGPVAGKAASVAAGWAWDNIWNPYDDPDWELSDVVEKPWDPIGLFS